MKKVLLLSYIAAGAGLVGAMLLLVHRGAHPSPAPARSSVKTPAPANRPREPRKRDSLNREVRGLYVTSWIAGMKRFRQIADGVAKSGLNAVVIDTKDCSGIVGYDSEVPFVSEIKSRQRRIRDIAAVLRYCHERKIYSVARIAVFQDPVLAAARPQLAVRAGQGGVWKDRKGQSWVDPASRTVWEYNVDLAKEAAALGFDEVQFDYVRFPTDGRLEGLAYPVYKGDVPKHQVIRDFFRYVDRELKAVDVIVSADIFGLTTVAEGDLNIGQRIEDVAPYVDFLCPMVYPSHYPPGFLGFTKPAERPYNVVYYSCVRGLDRISGQRARLRPWIQDFDLGASYDRRMILEQIRALRDAGAFGFCAWNARNDYTIEDYKEPLPAANPNPPLRASLLAEPARKHQGSSVRASTPAVPPAAPSPTEKLGTNEASGRQ